MNIFCSKYKVSLLTDIAIIFASKTSNPDVKTDNNRSVLNLTVSREAYYGIVQNDAQSEIPSSSLVDVSLLKTTQNIPPSSLLSGTRRTAGKMLHSIVMLCGCSPHAHT